MRRASRSERGARGARAACGMGKVRQWRRRAFSHSGACTGHLPHWSGIEQQHGFVHGGVVGMIADSAAGYAAMTMVPDGASVLTVEYKMNLLAPADGEKLIARGKVVRPGRTLIVTQAEVFAVRDGRETLCALMQQTIMVMHGKSEKA
ncbi:thioesterase [Janthinobacterium svalbardensis]|uniref:Thioesterase n=1 Tax=Janthinobacterium svalbardensis TaxID=368607 RepID=A0A290X3W5_9BURK|nr:thioesterase [Janthinobacterium svalbardensis]